MAEPILEVSPGVAVGWAPTLDTLAPNVLQPSLRLGAGFPLLSPKQADGFKYVGRITPYGEFISQFPLSGPYRKNPILGAAAGASFSCRFDPLPLEGKFSLAGLGLKALDSVEPRQPDAGIAYWGFGAYADIGVTIERLHTTFSLFGGFQMAFPWENSFGENKYPMALAGLRVAFHTGAKYPAIHAGQ